jgi:hypothetical protein
LRDAVCVVDDDASVTHTDRIVRQLVDRATVCFSNVKAQQYKIIKSKLIVGRFVFRPVGDACNDATQLLECDDWRRGDKRQPKRIQAVRLGQRATVTV